MDSRLVGYSGETSKLHIPAKLLADLYKTNINADSTPLNRNDLNKFCVETTELIELPYLFLVNIFCEAHPLFFPPKPKNTLQELLFMNDTEGTLIKNPYEYNYALQGKSIKTKKLYEQILNAIEIKPLTGSSNGELIQGDNVDCKSVLPCLLYQQF